MNIDLLVGTVLGAVVLALLLSHLVNLVARVTFGRRWVPDTGFVFALAGVALGLLVLFVHPGPLMEKLGAAGFVTASLGLFLAGVVEWVWHKRRLGPRLVSVRPPVGCLVLSAVICGSLLWTGIDELVKAGLDSTLHLATRISSTVFLLTVAVYFLVWLGFAGLELRERGCLTFSHHATWSEVESYRWKASGADWLTLELKGRGRAVPAMTGFLVPLAKKGPIDDVLRQRIPDATVASDLTPPKESMPWADASALLDRDELVVAQRAFRSELEVRASDGTCLCRVGPGRLGERFVMDKAGKQKFLAIKQSASATQHRSYQVFGPPGGEMLGCLQLKKPRSNEWEILDASQVPIGTVVRDASAPDLLHVRLNDHEVGTIVRWASLFLSENCRVRFLFGVRSPEERSLVLAAALLVMSVGALREVSVKRIVRLLVRLMLFLFGLAACASGALAGAMLFVAAHPRPGYWEWIIAAVLLVAAGSAMMILAYRLGRPRR